MNSMDEINLLRQAQRQHQHHLMVRGIGEEIDLEIGPGDDPSFSGASLVAVTSTHDAVVHADDHKSLLIPCSQTGAADGLAPQQQHLAQGEEEHDGMLRQPSGHTKKKKKVVKKWREEWADTYKWAYVAVHDNTTRIFCSVCKEYGRKHRRNPYGNEGSRNMQMSALEEHNNSLLHKEALRLQMASKEKLQPPEIERPVYVKALSKTAASILECVLRRDPHEAEYIQSIQEVVHSLEPVLVKNTQVPWIDDRGEAHVNRGFRVQFSQALGPCRGGLRFHPSMSLSVAKFLAFEHTLKNALSLYKLGGAAGGSDFDPKGKSDNEIMRFCQSFMDELYRYLGPDQDFPAEDIGVGPREMGYLFGQYRRLSGHFQGNFTGPKIFWSGSSFRTEATGYGLVFFARILLAEMNKELKGLRCVISGSGKIAMHVLEKLLPCGAIPVTVSDSKGYLLDEDGFDYMKYSLLRDIKAQQKSLKEYLKSYPHAKYIDDAKPWSEQCDVAFPCASHNEIDQGEAVAIINSGCRVLVECSNMPCTVQAVDILRKAKVIVAPAKATAAGGVMHGLTALTNPFTCPGVALGELELNPEFNLMQLSVEDFENKIQDAIKQTYERSIKAAQDYGIMKESPESLVHGANICAFLNIAQAMADQGCV
ncbi:NAD(P)-specific glutamate dehydrogenase isoform X3 [Sorghum bicolor]|uniref:NAD(P)-specific glutamate dehydrogenase isoform X3 n=1 Tax=Sorghum bicolor TaxID=4558 RepID=UPI000B42682D|nr:NAD(P)-specific glutamate dehydrogenase isoform X3 [Sorghum bicolor]|eukprot:XP_021310738.1 NAD(P)-specific glutamate dehydrogenase isoform X3 [Sorghum bicolor]